MVNLHTWTHVRVLSELWAIFPKSYTAQQWSSITVAWPLLGHLLSLFAPGKSRAADVCMEPWHQQGDQNALPALGWRDRDATWAASQWPVQTCMAWAPGRVRCYHECREARHWTPPLEGTGLQIEMLWKGKVGTSTLCRMNFWSGGWLLSSLWPLFRKSCSWWNFDWLWKVLPYVRFFYLEFINGFPLPSGCTLNPILIRPSVTWPPLFYCFSHTYCCSPHSQILLATSGFAFAGHTDRNSLNPHFHPLHLAHSYLIFTFQPKQYVLREAFHTPRWMG